MTVSDSMSINPVAYGMSVFKVVSYVVMEMIDVNNGIISVGESKT